MQGRLSKPLCTYCSVIMQWLGNFFRLCKDLCSILIGYKYLNLNLRLWTVSCLDAFMVTGTSLQAGKSSQVKWVFNNFLLSYILRQCAIEQVANSKEPWLHWAAPCNMCVTVAKFEKRHFRKKREGVSTFAGWIKSSCVLLFARDYGNAADWFQWFDKGGWSRWGSHTWQNTRSDSVMCVASAACLFTQLDLKRIGRRQEMFSLHW